MTRAWMRNLADWLRCELARDMWATETEGYEVNEDERQAA